MSFHIKKAWVGNEKLPYVQAIDFKRLNGGEGRNWSVRRPNLIKLCLILQASQALGGHYFSLGIRHFLYTVLYTA
jgi:hypothetical protein